MEISFKRTKILATVGPASSSPERLKALVQEGVNAFRLNFSHGAHSEHQKVIDRVRDINRQYGTNICLVQDLQGPKIRLGDVENGGIEIKEGQRIKLVCDGSVTTEGRLSTIYKDLAKDVNPGDAILLDDGKLEVKVISTDKDMEVEAEVIYGGVVKPRKGINLPDSSVSAPSMTEKDIEDLHFGLDNDVEWVALSFVRKAADIHEIKRIIAERGKTTRVIAKIEKPEAIKNIDEIIEATDAIMVARGDLGVEVGMEKVPMIQKMLVEKSNRAAKPVIVATQMMESMIVNPRPTRAETNDVANAVIDGGDALMLSAETAVGAYPIETIRSMTLTIKMVEENANIYNKNYVVAPNADSYYSDSLVANACNLARDTNARAIIGMTKSGYTAFHLSKHRPKSDIFVFTDNEQLLTTLNLVWGVRGFHYNKFESTDATIADIKDTLIEKGFLQKGDVFINTASMPLNEQKRTNMIKLSVV
ncbi:pyruvate kinase [Pontibacter ummariensis]|uniref:Pyruvate kinase n=1 Tax=Pontibacter ummariensis TaxID=1610492 RepID=A0A239EG04_9BACT|nr:pyruvate kinase [Pontibacter ummariensis]PRY13214.1 pyruvate kinase [Pontibacter ummariensis]SNS42943.1 pyruvate kinase [Pontibacter ummariensis]